MSTDFQLFVEFHRWVGNNQVIGTSDGLGNEAQYIPVDALEQYWQNHRISSILNSCSHDTPINVSIDAIGDRFLCIFSILVYISTSESLKLHYIQRFMEEDADDDVLPFKDHHHVFSNAADGIKTFEQFQNQQWLFSPASFGGRKRPYMKVLMPETVLPFTVEETLSGRIGEGTIVKKCKIHSSSGLGVDFVVLKEFDLSEVDLSFKNEVDSYITLKNKVRSDVYAQHFLQCYGSFKKRDRAFIMLEYTDQGSLLDLFKRNELPIERHELFSLWSSLSKLFVGLGYIHSLEKVSKNGTIRCVHQDIKPANIFVFKQGDETSYSYQFKIGDFGMSSIALVRTWNKFIKSPDNASTKMYGAPELTHHYSDLDDVDYGVTWDVDIWSMGCVLFEVLVWSICGSRGLSEFFRLRQQDTDNVPRHAAQGYSGCFHDGRSRIKAIEDMMGLIWERRRVFDNVSDLIGDLILTQMLRPSDESRLEARTLLHRFGDILATEKRSSDHRSMGDPVSSVLMRQGRHQSHGSTDDEDRGTNRHEGPRQARLHAPSPGNSGYERQRLKSPEFRTSGSLTGSRSSQRGTVDSQSSFETPPVHTELTSATRVHPFNMGKVRQSLSLEDEQDWTSNSPPDIGPAENIPIVGREAAAQEPARSSTYEHPPSEDPLPPGRGNLANGSLGMASSRKVKPWAKVPISDVLEWIEKKKGGWAAPLPDYDRAMREIKDREQIFVVDDSDTMRTQHWDRVVEVVRALGYLAKTVDPDGVELFFTSRPTDPTRSGVKETSSLILALNDHSHTPYVGTCTMENSLGPILEHAISSLKSQKRPKFLQRNRRGTNVYILTDAVWEGGSEVQCGVEEPIKNLKKSMADMGKTRATVALQFIQFGHDTLGGQRLRYLDDTLGKEIDFDIVDHRHWERDGVWHMLVGSISRDLDKDNNVGG